MHDLKVNNSRIQYLNAAERNLVRHAMQVLAWGPFIRDSEFQTVIGVERSELLRMVDAWPEAVVSSQAEHDPVRLQEIATSGVLYNLQEFPHREQDRLWTELGFSRKELNVLIQRWEVPEPPWTDLG